MKKPYQIESLRAVKRLEEMAADGNPSVQICLDSRVREPGTRPRAAEYDSGAL
jgi:hypothetical protein